MSSGDENTRFEVTGGPARYAADATGPVAGAAVTDGDQLLGYLWYGEDPNEDAAGMVYRLADDRAGNASIAWYGRLRERKAAGTPSADAVGGLLGERAEHPSAGAVGRELRRWPSLTALRDEVNPPEEVAESAPARRLTAAESERAAGPRASRAEIDAALRGLAPDDWPPQVRRSVQDLDSALAMRPTPDPLVVLRTTSWAELGADPSSVADRVVAIPTFLQVRFAAQNTEMPDGEVAMRLRVPVGVPAMYLPGANPGLLLGRGLGLRTTRLIESDGRWYLFGELLLPVGTADSG